MDSEGSKSGGMRSWFEHAFAVEAYDESSLSEEQRSAIDALAERIEERGLTAMAIFFVQSNKHYNWMGSQMMVFFEPFFEMTHGWLNRLLRHIGLNIPPEEYPVLTSAFEKRYSIEYLTQRLEHYAAEADKAKREAKVAPLDDDTTDPHDGGHGKGGEQE